jgi:hypothetical protein
VSTIFFRSSSSAVGPTLAIIPPRLWPITTGFSFLSVASG